MQFLQQCLPGQRGSWSLTFSRTVPGGNDTLQRWQTTAPSVVRLTVIPGVAAIMEDSAKRGKIERQMQDKILADGTGRAGIGTGRQIKGR